MGLSDYPSNSRKRLEGIAVGLFVRYPRCRIGLRGGRMYTLAHAAWFFEIH